MLPPLEARRAQLRKVVLTCLGVGGLLLAGRALFDRGSGTPFELPGRIGAAFPLHEGNARLLEPDGLVIRFVRKESDSRCPTRATCAAPGEARVRLAFSPGEGRDSTYLSLRIPGYVGARSRTHDHADTLGYRFTLLQLDPYPNLSSWDSDAPSVARLRVERR